MLRMHWAVPLAVITTLLVAPTEARAHDRRFTYTYGAATLGPGQREIEPWTTLRSRRESFYFAVDNRLELETGLADGLQTALYLNVSSTTEDVASATGVQRETETEWKGASWEWKLRLLDTVADPAGLALYLESSIGPGEAELEAKVIVDKRIGTWFLAWNLVGEYEAEFETQDVEHDVTIENDLGIADFVTPTVTVGLEMRNATLFGASEGFESSTFFAGPAVSFSREGWWTAMSVMPQLGSLRASEDEEEEAAEGEGESRRVALHHASAFDLEHHERLEMRLLMGFDL